MNITHAFPLRHNVKVLNISEEIISVHWAEYKSELRDKVACHPCVDSVLPRYELETRTFNTLAWPVAIRSGTDDDSIVKSMRVIRRGRKCSEGLWCIYLCVFMIEVPLDT